jgi:hypothetical protein
MMMMIMIIIIMMSDHSHVMKLAIPRLGSPQPLLPGLTLEAGR